MPEILVYPGIAVFSLGKAGELWRLLECHGNECAGLGGWGRLVL